MADDEGNAPKEQKQKKFTVGSAKIITSHMMPEHEEAALEVAIEAAETHNLMKDIAKYIKEEMDHRFPAQSATEGLFHVLAGQHFACCITHEVRFYIHLQIDRAHVVIFKNKDTPVSLRDLPDHHPGDE
ncbi:unnamed protein product [Pedinophyceae sp. YPF-701]|nr:unnamed protein product [Pedinophyceae sp. YPF-701]